MDIRGFEGADNFLFKKLLARNAINTMHVLSCNLPTKSVHLSINTYASTYFDHATTVIVRNRLDDTIRLELCRYMMAQMKGSNYSYWL